MTDAQRRTIEQFFAAADPNCEHVRITAPYIAPGYRRATSGTYEARVNRASVLVEPDGTVRG
jgi:hypothetical protein